MQKGIITFIIILAIIVGLGILVFQISRPQKGPNIKTLTINKSAEFDNKKIKLNNDEVLKIKNADTKKHTIKNAETGNIIVQLEPNETSKEIEFPDNSRNILAIEDKASEKSAIIVGNAPETLPEESGSKTEKPADKGSTQGEKTTAQNQPLPNTGPKNIYIYPIILIAGIFVFFVTKIFFAQEDKKKSVKMKLIRGEKPFA